jgi:hypothetical protein
MAQKPRKQGTSASAPKIRIAQFRYYGANAAPGRKPLTVREIMDVAFIAKGYNPDTEKIAKLRTMFNTAPRNQVGTAIRVIRDGPTVRWKLINKE